MASNSTASRAFPCVQSVPGSSHQLFEALAISASLRPGQVWLERLVEARGLDSEVTLALGTAEVQRESFAAVEVDDDRTGVATERRRVVCQQGVVDDGSHLSRGQALDVVDSVEDALL